MHVQLNFVLRRAALAAFACLTPLAAAAPAFVDGELLVKFADGSRGQAAEHAKQTMKHEVKRNLDAIGWQHVRLPKGLGVTDAIATYRRLPGVLAVEPNYGGPALDPLTTRTTDPVARASAVVPNDPLFANQWALTNIQAPDAWEIATGSSGVVVAVIDGGVNYDHEDLSANMWRNPGEVPGNRVDDDGNGYVDDIYGIDTADDIYGNDSDPKDQGEGFGYHGTLVAGVIGGVGNNNKGIAGVNWKIQLMALRVIWYTNWITTAGIAEAFNYVVTMKRRGVNIRVSNNSYGWSPGDAYKDALYAAANEGILHICAAGNSTNDVDRFGTWHPSEFDHPRIVSVAASDWTNGLAFFSNYGVTNVDLAAPGVSILTTTGLGSYERADGTSFASPYVAGAAALLAGAQPDASADEIKTALLDSVDILSALTNRVLSKGRLNVNRALRHPNFATNQAPVIVTQPISVAVMESSNATFSVVAVGTYKRYQWQHQRVPLDGATNSTLVLSNVTASMGGEYQAVVSNQAGAVTNAVAVLNVLVRPQLVQPLTALSLSAVVGETITLSAQTTGSLPIGYRWRRIAPNGSAVNLTNMVIHQNTCFFTFTVASNSIGNYTLVLTNAAQPTSAIQRTNAFLTLLADTNTNRMADIWESTYQVQNPASDDDADGLSNVQEYLAGTNPKDPQSCLRLAPPTFAPHPVISFHAASNQTYTLQFIDDLSHAAWRNLYDVVARPVEHTVTVPDLQPAANRFYRLLTPRQR